MISKDEIIRIGRESGYLGREIMGQYDYLERFASLVAAHTQEQCAKVCDQQWGKGAEIAAYCNHGNDNDWCFDAEYYMKVAAENATSVCADAIRAMK